MTETLAPDQIGIARAAELLRQGDLVAFPTETVYGLGADARSDTAVARVFEAKGRPSFNPLIVHVQDLAYAERAAVLDQRARQLAAAFWPGPLTMVLPLRPDVGISALVTVGQSSVAIRVPAHPVAQALLRAFGGPVAAPSANPSGRISPTSADHVLDGLSGRIAAVIDGGPCKVGIESTILSLIGDSMLLRPGGVKTDAIETILGLPLICPVDVESGPLPAPGMMESHYAPDAVVRLHALSAQHHEVMIGFGDVGDDLALNLSPDGDLVEAASRLFHVLRMADRKLRDRPLGFRRIAVAPIPEAGLGQAINDRLRRAAAPRTA